MFLFLLELYFSKYIILETVLISKYCPRIFYQDQIIYAYMPEDSSF